MVAFLDLDVLRAHAVPLAVPVECGGAAPAVTDDPRPPARPVLAARWSVASDGRLICRWHVVAAASPSPH